MQQKNTPRVSKLQHTSEIESELSEAKLENEKLKGINQMVEQLLQSKPNAQLRNIIQQFQTYYADNQARLMKLQEQIITIRNNMNRISELANALQDQYLQDVQTSQNEEICSQIMGSSIISPHITMRENRRTMFYQPTPRTSRRDTIEEITENLKITVEDNLADNEKENNQGDARAK